MSTKAQANRILRSFRDLGQIQTIAIGPAEDGLYPLYDGHQRVAALFTVKNPDYELLALQSNRQLTEDERKQVAVLLHTATGGWDWNALSGWSAADLREWGMDKDTLKGWQSDAKELTELLNSEQAESTDAEPQIDRAAELLEKWQVKTGDLWQIGEHRLLCGDSTKREDVERVMGGERAVLLHADPPYGMGKENEGVENDNLYREKLDAFQMSWWKACRPFIADNGSVYIWGNAEDLWRLWYRGGLKDSERLTFRNEIYWIQEGTSWGRSGMSGLRQFAENGERCLFFMLGEQGFNNNSDNYWNGWDNVRIYLKNEADKVGLTPEKVKNICGVGMYSHWFTESQWTFIPEEHYKKLQDAFKKDYDAFKKDYDELKKDYDELKKDFYDTRAYFRNPVEDNCSDVWFFERVKGDDSELHATPKPVELVERAIKASSQENSLVIEPFAGSGTTLVACQNLGRKCRAIEISPAYCSVILERMSTAFPQLEIKRL